MKKRPSDSRFAYLADVAAVLSVAIALLWRLRLKSEVIAAYDDDFFYYLKPAANFYRIGKISFDGIHLTNGFHPLWFLLVSSLYAARQGFGFYVLFQVVQSCLFLLTYALLTRTLRRDACGPLLPRIFSLCLLLLALLLSSGGMEVTGFFTSFAAVVAYRLRPDWKWTSGRSLTYGFLLSLMVLSRLDSLILAGLLLFADLLGCPESKAKKMKSGLLIGCGLLPVLAYFLFNHAFFGVWMPVSAIAKDMKQHFPPVFAFRALLATAPPRLAALFVTACVSAAFTIWSVWKDRSVPYRWLLAAMAIFPLLHFASVCFLSDWPIWPWYYYSCLVGLLPSALLITLRVRRERPFAWAIVFESAVALGLAVHIAAQRTPSFNPIYLENLALAPWMDQHPGLYAMGDRSGMLAWMSHQPVLQTEGLMLDRDYLEIVRRRPPLMSVLQSYGVNYYITLLKPSDCFVAQEPAMAGPLSPSMHGSLCRADNLAPSFSNYGLGVFQVPASH